MPVSRCISAAVDSDGACVSRWLTEERPASRQRVSTGAIGEQTEVTNARETPRRDVQEKAAQEFVGLQRQDLHAVVVSVVFPTKPDAAVTVLDEPIIRQGDSVRVAPEIAEDLVGTGEGPFGIHDPVDRPQSTEQRREGVAIGQIGRAIGEAQLARSEGPSQGGEILRAKDCRERPHRKEKGRPPGDPARVVRGHGAPGDQTVQMEVLREILAPRVQNRRDADGAAEMSRVSPEGEQRVGSRAKQERIDHARIALRERVEVVRQGEDDVEVRNGQQVGAPRREPPRCGEHLTLRTMSIATGVVGNPHGAAAVTRLLMAAERGGAAGRDSPQGSVLHRGEPVRALVGVAMVADDVRQLEPRTGDHDRRAPWHGAHDQPSGGGAKRASRSSGESGPPSV